MTDAQDTTPEPDGAPDIWAPRTLAEGETGRWRLGPLTLWVQRRHREWRVVREQGDDPLDPTVQVEVPTAAPFPDDDETFERFASHHEDNVLSLAPRLADRNVIARPDRPLHLLAGARVELYVSTPIWVAVHAHGTTLRECPTYRPPDTWFGATTTRGEVCYASRTAARLELAEVPLRPSRAVTAVTMYNGSYDPLRVERFAIPVHTLELFVDPGGAFWTQSVTLERESRGTARLLLATGPPKPAGPARRVEGARRAPAAAGLSRALEAMFA